jgi:hypothetical protein
MCTSIALPSSELPLALVRRHHLQERLYDREGRAEFQFHWWEEPSLLPVHRDGCLEVLPWGCKNRRGPLPSGGWVTEEQVADGILGHPEEVVIPARLGQHKGTWFLIVEGIKGVAVQTRDGYVVYMLTQRASNYFRNMTEQSPMMPIFVNQVI